MAMPARVWPARAGGTDDAAAIARCAAKKRTRSHHNAGATTKAFSHDPDRYVMALAIAYWALGASRRGGCEIAVASIEGWPIGPRRERDNGGHGLSLLDLEYELQTAWCGTASIEGRARGLRAKIKKALRDDPGAAAWLREMGDLFLLALNHGRDRGAGEARSCGGRKHLAKPSSRASDSCRCAL